MKIRIYAKSWLVLEAETMEDSFKLGVLQEALKASGRDIPVMASTIIEIPLQEIKSTNTKNKLK